MILKNSFFFALLIFFISSTTWAQGRWKNYYQNYTGINPQALLPDGTAVKPTNFRGGYHGSSKVKIEDVLDQGFLRRGSNWDLKDHVEQRGNSAFRGVTEMSSDPVGESGAVYWAGVGGWVFEIRHIPTWDVNTLLEGRVRTAFGYRGNLMRGENELAIPAHIPLPFIKKWGKVTRSYTGKLRVKEWHNNPSYCCGAW